MDTATIEFMKKMDLIEKILNDNKGLDNSDLAYVIANKLINNETR